MQYITVIQLMRDQHDSLGLSYGNFGVLEADLHQSMFVLLTGLTLYAHAVILFFETLLISEHLDEATISSANLSNHHHIHDRYV